MGTAAAAAALESSDLHWVRWIQGQEPLGEMKYVGPLCKDVSWGTIFWRKYGSGPSIFA